MLSFITANPSITLILVPLLMIFIVTLYLISYFLKNPLNIGIGPIKLVFGGGKKSSIEDTSLVLDKIKSTVYDYQNQIIDLKYETLRRQLNYSEEKLNDIKSLLSDVYSDLLKTKLDDKSKEYVKSHEQYKNYQMLIKIALNECVLVMLKKCFKENHLDEMDHVDWDNYIRHKTDTGIQHISDFLDLMYGHYFIVTREELRIANLKNSLGFYNMVKDIFDTGKEIQRKNNKKIENLELELDKEIKEINENLKR